MICPVHNIPYSYTCWVCEEELRYHSGGLDAFRAGYNKETNRFHSHEDLAAYENGKRIREHIDKSE